MGDTSPTTDITGTTSEVSVPPTPFTLTVKFHGTIAMVPSGDGRTMRMLLGKFDPTAEVPQQIPYVRFADENWSRANTRPKSGPPANAPAAVQNLRYVAIDGEFLDLVADIDRADQALRPNNAKDPVSPTPVKTDANSLYWLPHLDRISPPDGVNPATADIEPALLAFPLTKAGNPTVAARIDLTQGRLDSSGVLPVQVTFVDNLGVNTRHPIARDSVLTLTINDDHFYLRSKPINGNRSSGNLDMRFDRNGSNEVEIVIGNEPAADIFEPAPPFQPDQDPAREFGLFYQMSQRQPVVNQALPLSKGRAGLHQLCAQAVYNSKG